MGDGGEMRGREGRSVVTKRAGGEDGGGQKMEDTMVNRSNVVATLALNMSEQSFERSHAEVNQCYEMVFACEWSSDNELQRRTRLVLAASNLMEAVSALKKAAKMDAYRMALQVKQKISAVHSASAADPTKGGIRQSQGRGPRLRC